ncbi:Uncharacterised protein [Mycobacterium tuberculosis]|nr:Uncharacterised protein [Mycobacterium tuberculosis]
MNFFKAGLYGFVCSPGSMAVVAHTQVGGRRQPCLGAGSLTATSGAASWAWRSLWRGLLLAIAAEEPERVQIADLIVSTIPVTKRLPNPEEDPQQPDLPVPRWANTQVSHPSPTLSSNVQSAA